MNEELPWTAVVFAIGQIFAHLLLLATAISYFRTGQSRRKSLLTGALIVVLTGIGWDLAAVSRDVFLWMISAAGNVLTWLSVVGSLLFYITLLLIAMGRRNQARRIAELEAILQDREAIAKSSQAAAP